MTREGGGAAVNGMALCAGAGGLELGLRIALGAEYRCVVYVEREAYAAATLVARMADATLDTAPVWDDIGTFDGLPWRGVVDLVSAGFSCQPWSSAGKRLGIADERWLWPDIDRILREVRPEWVFLENVPGLVHGGLEHVLGSLAAQGFAAEWDCVSAAEVGASQLRERLYILAHASNGRHWQPTEPVVCGQEPDSDNGGTLAGSSSRGRGILRQSSGSGGQPDGNRQAVADAKGERSRETGRLRANQPRRSDRRGSALADTDTAGFGSVGSLVISHNGQTTRRDHADGRSRPSAVLDDADGRRCGWQDDEVRPGRSRPGRAGYWPPDRAYAGNWPSGFEPAVRRVADGMAPWLERLRLTGNGVVPLGAAVAFLRLRARLMGGQP